MLLFLHNTHGNRKIASVAIRYDVFLKNIIVFFIFLGGIADMRCGKKAQNVTIMTFLKYGVFWGGIADHQQKKSKNIFFFYKTDANRKLWS